ncbi:MAG: family 43 glycosylhydrolase, partial [Alistipes sp.]|nr:family 43 glycosylhydrolase [Alistipes sp.]
MKNLFLLAVVALLISCSGVKSDDKAATYTNPVIDNNAPDPTVIRAKDGTFYAYSTMMYGNVPVYKSQDMINWEYIGG